jgi:hypothetical protein
VETVNSAEIINANAFLIWKYFWYDNIVENLVAQRFNKEGDDGLPLITSPVFPGTMVLVGDFQGAARIAVSDDFNIRLPNLRETILLRIS